MPAINPHINFNGNAEEAFKFYQSVFGGSITKLVRYKDLSNAGFQPSDNEKEKVMHIVLAIGECSLLMGNDVPEIMGKTNERENRSKIVVAAASKEEAAHIFNGLSQGGEIEGPIGDSPWGTYFGCFRDRYGIEWIIEYDQRAKDREAS